MERPLLKHQYWENLPNGEKVLCFDEEFCLLWEFIWTDCSDDIIGEPEDEDTSVFDKAFSDWKSLRQN